MKAKFISIYLCIMLMLVVCVGGTMAYFTDTTEAAVNTIVAGNLDVEMEYSLDGGVNWAPLTKDTANILEYMPGVERTVMIKIVNAGSLALEYDLGTMVKANVLGRNDEGGDIDLSTLLQVVVANHDGSDPRTFDLGKKLMDGTLAAGETRVISLTVLLPSSVGNSANYRVSDDPDDPYKYRPYIELGLFAAATQTPHETDSFGSDYDAAATVPTH